jgi:hypothetical protein
MRSFGIVVCCVLAGAPVGAADQDEVKTTPVKHAGLEKLKKLTGEWVAADADGKATERLVSVFKVTAGGSAVQETIFPGTGHEMMTLYHLDGPNLVLTHYCSAGNQPHMKADPKAPANQLKFVFSGGTNFDPARDMHIHEGSIVFLDDDRIEWSWVGYKDGKPQAAHTVALKLVRKK